MLSYGAYSSLMSLSPLCPKGFFVLQLEAAFTYYAIQMKKSKVICVIYPVDFLFCFYDQNDW
jgi:hypothetical protein